MLKKIITLTMIAILCISTTFSYAANGTQTQAAWRDTLTKLETMGIIEESELNTTSKMTRDVFSKIIINSTGNYELAQSLREVTTFADVAKTSDLCGYINAAVNKGYLTAYADGKFKPKNNVTFAQLCTAMVNALGYTSNDIVGIWPKGHIDKAKSLGLTTGFNYNTNDEVPTSSVIIMIGRMLNTNIKKNNTQDAGITLKESAGLTNDQANWVYSEPEVAFDFNPDTKKLGNIAFKANIPILRNTIDNSVSPATSVIGEKITLDDIKDKDVVYEVYNKLNVLIYYLVIDNKIEGKITSILPNKYAPTAIQINNVKYDLGETAKIDKFNSSNGSFGVDDHVSVVLGYDGKVVDAYYVEDDNNKEYAFVVDCATKVSEAAADYGKVYYTVSLMHVDGTTKTYKIAENASGYKWRLVKYSYVDDETVALLKLAYRNDAEILVDRYQRKIGHNYITDNVKIFNYTDETVNLIKWNDIPDGVQAAGKVKYLATTGDFDDVCVILTNDIFNKQYRNYVVKSIIEPSNKNLADENSAYYQYNLVSGSDNYTYISKTATPISGVIVGSVLKMKLYNNKVSTFSNVVTHDLAGIRVQAIDSKRIKINNMVYLFDSNVAIYVKDYKGSLTAKKYSDIEINTDYPSIKLYFDRPINDGGKVQIIVIGNN
ncbi:S-layer homology domain-containing protein [Ruminiclostridium herbifermentans]|uniref:S-layer homology domain-containing protein n=1 Tax=Ruminiclostridium herbifermentans TaxID=2488810 RepID=A0A4U7JK90_9FIRM|nr:S-layer homology domain-containing protein [Ruminiclostridium herbifermentans]QNU68161.1 S-layer homology domain-containing protein [Ruminiclostridium herbifermentans]